MARKYLIMATFVFVLVAILISGCGAEPTPDPSIVWSDDFEDGDTEEWEQTMGDDEYLVTDGVLTFGKMGGDIRHPNSVTIGTWSFDLFLQEGFLGETHDVTFLNVPMEMGVWMEIFNLPNTQIWIYSYNDSQEQDSQAFLDLGERLVGWHHFDVTRDDSGQVKVYMDGEFVVDLSDDFPYESEYFYYFTCCEGQALDNVVVRNQVIDIQPAE
jgi:hypothetical protein